MAFQTDVKQVHAAVSGVAIPFCARIKGIVWMPYAAITEHSTIVNNKSLAATYTRVGTVCTITTSEKHRLFAGAGAELFFAGAGPTDDFYVVQSTPTSNTFTVTVADAGDLSGTVTVWNEVLFHMDTTTELVVPIEVPGDGLLASDGVRVFLGADMHVSLFYS